MTKLNDLHPLLLNSLQTSLAVGVLFALVLVARRPFARQFGAKAAYALWLIPLARLAMPPIPANFSLFGLLGPAEATSSTTVTTVQERTHAIAVTEAHSGQPHLADLPSVPAVPAPPPVELSEPGLFDAFVQIAPQLILPVWIAGALMILGVAWRRQAVFHQLIRDDSDEASERIAAMTNEIAGELGVKRGFDVRTSLLNGSPLVTGLIRPVILLPAWIEDDYSPREQRDALTHELMHVKRNDLLALQAAQFVLALQWFNPLAHLAMRAFRVDQEAACDADVLRAGTSSAFSYGQTLIKAARLAGPADGAFRGANLTLTHPIKERLILMQNSAPTLRRRLLGSTLALTLGSAAIVATASCAASAAPMQNSEPELAGGEEKIERHTRVYRFGSTGEDENRQFVLLSDPFQKLGPRLKRLENLDLSDLETEMHVLTLEMDDLGELSELQNLEELEALGELGKLGMLAGLGSLGSLGDINLNISLSDVGEFDIKSVKTEDGVRIMFARPGEETITINPDEMEEIIETHAEKIEALAERHAERAEIISVRLAERMESRAERMEEIGEKMEMRIERAFEDGLEDDLESAGETVEQMAEQCEEREPSLNTPTIISYTADDGETFRALCVNGSSDRLADEDVISFVQTTPELSDEERARFGETRTYSYSYSSSEN